VSWRPMKEVSGLGQPMRDAQLAAKPAMPTRGPGPAPEEQAPTQMGREPRQVGFPPPCEYIGAAERSPWPRAECRAFIRTFPAWIGAL